MTDPKAWAKGLSRDRRSVLEAGRKLAAPVATKQAVWSALAVKLPATGAAAAVAKGAATLSLTKVLAIGFGVGATGVAGFAGYRTLSTEDPAPRSVVSARTVPASPPSAIAPTLGPEHDDVLLSAAAPLPALSAARSSAASFAERAHPRATASAKASAEAPVSPAESTTLLESKRLAAARAAWRAGDANGALHELEALDRDVPRGVLGQEREALRIQVLAAAGNKARAKELARRFLALHPDSPHAEAIQRVLR
jgi:hypothetical protein